MNTRVAKRRKKFEAYYYVIVGKNKTQPVLLGPCNHKEAARKVFKRIGYDYVNRFGADKVVLIIKEFNYTKK